MTKKNIVKISYKIAKKKTKKVIDPFYAGKSKKDWIKWATREIEEYKSFIKFLKGK